MIRISVGALLSGRAPIFVGGKRKNFAKNFWLPLDKGEGREYNKDRSTQV